MAGIIRADTIAMHHKAILEKYVLLLAIIFLFLGILFYAFIYPNKFTSIIIANLEIIPYKIDLINNFTIYIIYSFTSFCHVIFMTFFSIAAFKGYNNSVVIFWSLVWGGVDSSFELLQIKSEFTQKIYYIIPEYINIYFKEGSFDFIDLIFIWLGVLFSNLLWLFLKNTTQTKINNI